MESRKVKTVLVGVGGYGASYLSYFADGVLDWDRIALEGAVDPYAEKSPCYSLLLERHVPIYKELSDFYREKDARLAVISTPIPLHRPQCEIALAHGSDVLCEKPLVSRISDWEGLRQAERASGKRIGVGFQMSFSRTMLGVKQDVLAGALGKPVCLRAVVHYPRGDSYYAGSSWKGRLWDSDGHFVNDSIASNAAAHYLHNIFFVLGPAPEASLTPAEVTAELYRAKDIETFDTCFISGKFPSGAEFFYAASHAGADAESPSFAYEFENAVVTMNDGVKDDVVRARFSDGSEKVYGDLSAPEESARKLAVMLDYAQNGGVIPCGLETVYPHVALCDALSKADAAPFPESMKVRGETGVFCPELDGALRVCYQNHALPSELGFSWSKNPRRIVF
ncbi:MAG: Gfo/Idh/MocA family oxidoreductase [Defluviitaleaceae bacterium]|nr:Gfo/Idh/MocA family oxidoreductase [Defluviitaleaceae bacterium]